MVRCAPGSPRRRSPRIPRAARSSSASALTFAASKSLAARDVVVGEHVLGRDRLADLADLVDRVEEQPPLVDVVPAPALALVPVAAEDVGELHHRFGRDLRRQRRGQRRELLEHDVRRGARVEMAELEPHRPGAQIGLVELLLRRVLEVGAADHEAVGRELARSRGRGCSRSRGPGPSTARAGPPSDSAASPWPCISAWPQRLPASA